MTPPTYHGACEVCGALYYWHRVTVPKNWRKPDDLEGATTATRLQCDHVLSKHATLYSDLARETREPSRPSRRSMP